MNALGGKTAPRVSVRVAHDEWQLDGEQLLDEVREGLVPLYAEVRSTTWTHGEWRRLSDVPALQRVLNEPSARAVQWVRRSGQWRGTLGVAVAVLVCALWGWLGGEAARVPAGTALALDGHALTPWTRIVWDLSAPALVALVGIGLYAAQGLARLAGSAAVVAGAGLALGATHLVGATTPIDHLAGLPFLVAVWVGALGGASLRAAPWLPRLGPGRTGGMAVGAAVVGTLGSAVLGSPHAVGWVLGGLALGVALGLVPARAAASVAVAHLRRWLDPLVAATVVLLAILLPLGQSLGLEYAVNKQSRPISGAEVALSLPDDWVVTPVEASGSRWNGSVVIQPLPSDVDLISIRTVDQSGGVPSATLSDEDMRARVISEWSWRATPAGPRWNPPQLVSFVRTEVGTETVLLWPAGVEQAAEWLVEHRTFRGQTDGVFAWTSGAAPTNTLRQRLFRTLGTGATWLAPPAVIAAEAAWSRDPSDAHRLILAGALAEAGARDRALALLLPLQEAAHPLAEEAAAVVCAAWWWSGVQAPPSANCPAP